MNPVNEETYILKLPPTKNLRAMLGNWWYLMILGRMVKLRESEGQFRKIGSRLEV